MQMEKKVLTQQIKNLKKRNSILMGVSGLAFIAACVFAVLWSNASLKTKNDKPQSVIMSAALDSLDSSSEELTFIEKEEGYIKTIDSLKKEITDLTVAAEDTLEIETASSTYVDYIAQMLENAKRFSGTDCNKSLAFLYAAKKVAKMEERTGPNVDAIKVMINKCEESLFGTTPSSSK